MIIDGAMGTVIQQYKLQVREAAQSERLRSGCVRTQLSQVTNDIYEASVVTDIHAPTKAAILLNFNGHANRGFGCIHTCLVLSICRIVQCKMESVSKILL